MINNYNLCEGKLVDINSTIYDVYNKNSAADECMKKALQLK